MKIEMLTADQIMVTGTDTEMSTNLFSRAGSLFSQQLDGELIFKSIRRDDDRPTTRAIVEIMSKGIETLNAATELIQNQ